MQQNERIVMEVPTDTGQPAGVLGTIGIWVDDVDEIYARVQAAGVNCDAPTNRDFGVRMLNVPDEMGYLWGFIRRV
jgi:uncharacterized glyoxalase superfamily protein PhnB